MIRYKLLIGFALILVLGLFIQAVTSSIPPLIFVSTSIITLILFFMAGIYLTRPLRKLQEAMQSMQPNKPSKDEIAMAIQQLSFFATEIKDRDIEIDNRRKQGMLILDSLIEPVVACDKGNNTIVFNKATETITGMNKATALGKPIDDILHLYEDEKRIPFAEYSDQSLSMIEKLRTNGLNMSNAQGDKVTVTMRVIPIRSNEQLIHVLTFHDTSEALALEEMKLDFVSMAAHELRTPLTAIRGYASLLELQHAGELNDNGKELVKRLLISGETLGNLIDNLLTVSRIEKNMFSIATKPTDPLPLLMGVIDTFRKTTKAKRQKLLIDVPNELPIIFADSFCLSQVLFNLIMNATTYAPDGTTIMVKAEKRDAFLQVTVSDTGPGIPKEAIPKLFTKFFRVPGSLEESIKGTGLGLFISKTIIELHNGKIWVESEPEKGSIFTFLIPIATPQLIARYQQQQENASLTVKNGRGIIIKNV
ncbi:MAG: ATP-binding protein [Patescibacteria group bacterium]